ncbi:MAG: endonuclease III domain-containing protein [Chlamydiota bacterium]|nr:endonuclease III domain-containing protein [Chlamydiota bacterium]
MQRSSSHINRIYEIYKILYREWGPQYWWPAENSFEVIIGAILTQNTSWLNVEKALGNLKKKRWLDPAVLSKISEKALASAIRPAGYYNLKAKRLKIFMRWYQSVVSTIPDNEPVLKTRERLLGIHGIGPETADSILLYAFHKKSFVVDAYTKRIFSRHGLIDEEASYESVKNLFESNLPRTEKVYNEYHALIVKLGKVFCKKKAVCGQCPLRHDLADFLKKDALSS